MDDIDQDGISKFKANQKIAWASFALLENLTGTAAPHLIHFAGIHSGQKVLDVACGTGVVTKTFRINVEKAQADGTIAAAIMLASLPDHVGSQPGLPRDRAESVPEALVRRFMSRHLIECSLRLRIWRRLTICVRSEGIS